MSDPTPPPQDNSEQGLTDAEKTALRKEKKAQKEAEKAAKAAKAKAKAEQRDASKQGKESPSPSAEAVNNDAKKEKDIRLRKEFVNTTPPGEKKDLNMFPLTVDSAYDPPAVEAAWYTWWENQGFFSPDKTNKEGQLFTIVIPPPNVTGSLHLGHALTNSIQDAICRYQRMRGKRVLWVPGTDHAGIATQAVVEKKLWKEEKKTRQDLPRDEFVSKVWEWKNQYGNRITDQLRRIGSSLDWQRERFTLDQRLSRAVTEAFVQMSRKGKIYRGTRLVNWSCKLRTAISDIEVEPLELTKKTKLKVPGHQTDKLYDFGAIWEFAYKIRGSENDELVVATTRPETMLGDTAIAVHPDDPRYKHLHGKFAVHPFIPDRKIPIITDGTLVDMNFGTGAVKITPAHDPNDYACGERNKLEFINIFNLDGSINANGGKFAGMMRFDARIAVLGELKSLNLYRGVKDNPMTLGKCSRSGDIIEPMLVPQWWVRCGQMAENALKAVKDRELQILPDMFVTTWNSWLGEIRDWCISRQLWWGHRIPAWLVHFEGQLPSNPALEDFWIVAHDQQEARELAQAKWPAKTISSLEQDPDVLDTWFSSALFPFSVFGWPINESSSPQDKIDFETFYPTALLETGHDILFFWVARMVMMGLELTGKLPFKQVLLHAMVRDAHGRKMSKSLGNVVDPLDVIEGITKADMVAKLKQGNLEDAEVIRATQGIEEDFPQGISECGTDALRFALCSYTSQGRDINLDIKRVIAYRNFCNKIWNCFKLAAMIWGMLPAPGGDGVTPNGPVFSPPSFSDSHSNYNSDVDNWILSRLNFAISECVVGFDNYDFARATSAIYSFWLYELCDVYLEAIKPIAFANPMNPTALEAVRSTLYTCVEEGLRMIHPFMPFLSEELWQRLPRRPSDAHLPSICVSSYPHFIESRNAKTIESEVSAAQAVAASIRSLRVDYNLAKKHTPHLVINTHNEQYRTLYSKYAAFIRVLSYCGQTEITLDIQSPPEGSAAAIPNNTCEAYLVIKGLVDAKQEIQKLTTKVAALSKQKETLQKKMASPAYAKVPAEVQAADTTRLQSMEDEITNMNKAIANFEAL